MEDVFIGHRRRFEYNNPPTLAELDELMDRASRLAVTQGRKLIGPPIHDRYVVRPGCGWVIYYDTVSRELLIRVGAPSDGLTAQMLSASNGDVASHNGRVGELLVILREQMLLDDIALAGS